MPYASNADLPTHIKNTLPAHAQDIYRMAFNHAWREYTDPGLRRRRGSREEISHRVAWAAVKTKYVRKKGKWVTFRRV